MLVIGICLGATVARAQIVISEVMYDAPGSDSKAEWIEIYNTGAVPIDIGTWKLIENNVAHRLTREEGTVLGGGEYGIIAHDPRGFLNMYPDVHAPVFDSSFSLSNTGETLSIRDGDEVIADTVTYTREDGAAGDGNTLNYSNGTVVVRAPSPGSTPHVDVVANVSEETAQDTDIKKDTKSTSAKSENSISAHRGSVPVQSVPFMSAFSLMQLRDQYVPRNTVVEMTVHAQDGQDISRVGWSFGDATIGRGTTVRHVYTQSGTYVVIARAWHTQEEALVRARVTVFEPEVYFAAVTDAYVELFNMSPHEINLGGWILETDTERFVFPEDTIMPTDSLSKFDRGVLGGSFYSQEVIRLYTPTGVRVAVYEGV